MPRFYFNHISQGTTCIDDIGADFLSLEAAYLDTCDAALAIAFEKLRARQDPTADAFNIIDAQKTLLMHVPFSEVLHPAATAKLTTIKQQSTLVLEHCRRQVARGETLNDELRAEFARARKLFDDIHANLAVHHPA